MHFPVHQMNHHYGGENGNDLYADHDAADPVHQIVHHHLLVYEVVLVHHSVMDHHLHHEH